MTGEHTMSVPEIRQHAVHVAEATGADVLVDQALGPHLSMRVGGVVPALIKPTSPDMAADVVRRLVAASVPHRLLGGGSNVLADDSGLDFVVVHLGAATMRSCWSGTDVLAPAGMTMAALLREATQAGLSGLEWAAGLPGTIGGAVVGNAGAFGGETAQSVRSVRLMAADGSTREHVVAPGDFGYRHSFVRPGEIVLEVTLRLVPSTVAAVRAEADRVNRTRAASQPKGGHSSGCVFRNAPEAPAGKLVDECGLKGRRRGGAFVSPTHGNFIINDGSASAQDILQLIDEVRAEVLRQKGVELQLEVNIWSGTPTADGSGRET